MPYLLDTNICIYIIKRKPTSVLEKFATLSTEEMYLSTITVAELQYGVRKSAFPEKNGKALQQFLSPFNLLPFDFTAAAEYGLIRAGLEAKGTPIGALDMLIGAQAKSNGFVLVTNNVKEFERVEGLVVENWV